MPDTRTDESSGYDDGRAWSILHAAIIILVGFACQPILVKLFPMTGLGRIVSAPLGLLFSVVVAVGYVRLYRRVRRPVGRGALFAGCVALVCVQAVTFHPQDNMVSAWVLLARQIFGS